ncbi:hypothetical protein [Polymorphospora rubra]|uniref:hypothetical protein n=1 Tax=Polymorphospora rubra TaxID=338584 RepID=UPI0033C6826A
MEFTRELLVRLDFPDLTDLRHGVVVGASDEESSIVGSHTFVLPDDERYSDYSDIVFSLSVRFAGRGVRVGISVEADLSVGRGKYPAGKHLLHRNETEPVVFEEALSRMALLTDELCACARLMADLGLVAR